MFSSPLSADQKRGAELDRSFVQGKHTGSPGAVGWVLLKTTEQGKYEYDFFS